VSKRRTHMASMAASCVLLLMVVMGLWLGAISAGRPPGEAFAGSAGHLGFFVFLLGLPMCFPLTSAVGWALVGAERSRSKRLSWFWRIGVPSLLAAFAFPVVWWWFWGKPFAPILWAGWGLFGGTLAALLFWRIAGSASDAQTVDAPVGSNSPMP
jgi:hypothetical protein